MSWGGFITACLIIGGIWPALWLVRWVIRVVRRELDRDLAEPTELDSEAAADEELRRPRPAVRARDPEADIPRLRKAHGGDHPTGVGGGGAGS